MDAIAWEWLSLVIRWTHVIAGIAWIGSSFYFIHLDAGLRRHAELPQGVGGDAWQVHGGGFYHIQKYMVAPASMPEELTWFKWEAYSTWISGFLLLAVLYYAGAEIYLVDRSVLDMPGWAASLIGVASLAAGWIVYDLLCKSPLGARDGLLAALGFALLEPRAPELARLHRWLDTWTGVGRIVTGMLRAGYRLHLTNIDADVWRATFSRAAFLAHDGFGAGPTPWKAIQVAAWNALVRLQS
jgi:uncharacterized membrane protein